MLQIIRRVFSFGDWSRTHPAQPHPGDMLDAQFDEIIHRVTELEDRVARMSVPVQLVAPPPLSTGRTTVAGAGDAAEAEAWALTSRDWAEHMPGVLPENSLTSMDITGDHWSSRWWAHFAARAAQAKTLIRGRSTRYLFFAGEAGQSVFEGFDYYGVPLLIDWDMHAVEVYVDGRLATPEMDYATSNDNRLIFNAVLPGGAKVEILVTIPFELIPRWQLDVSGWVFDGVQTTFPLIDAASGNPLVPDQAIELMLSLDGVWLNGGTDYLVVDNDVEFTDPPRSDSKVFGHAEGGGITVGLEDFPDD